MIKIFTKFIPGIITYILLSYVLCSICLAQDVIHPRGLISASELPQIRERLTQEPLKSYLKNFIQYSEKRLELIKPKDIHKDKVYISSHLATLYLLTEDKKWANIAWEYLDEIISNEGIFNDPLSRGLTRATLLQNAAITYDFCYDAWNTKQRQKVNAAIFKNIVSVNANMGHSANYNIASNWMGVRYGAVIFAISVWDPPQLKEGERSPANPYFWDATKRLQDHIEAVFYENGWNGESMGYFGYDWSFMSPALIALNNQLQHESLKLENFAPKLLNTLWGMCSQAVDIPNENRRGIKPDLSDDHPIAFGPAMLATSFRLYPRNQQAYLKWFFDYRFPPDQTYDERHGLIHTLLYYPLDIEAYNPREKGWLNYHDPEQGIVVFRNQFKDSTDIVMTMSATSKRVRGHQGPDTHTWRLLGLGVPWVIGGGRNGATYLQTNLFPDSLETPPKKKNETGILHAYRFFPQGGYALSSGSCLNVKAHQRYLQVDYRERTECEAVFVLEESSENGKRWRIQTPEFNKFEPLADGYLLTAPNGATMQVKVLKMNTPTFELRSGLHRYGGNTIRLNPGIGYNGRSYAQSRWIDILCEGNLTVLITLQRAGKVQPEINQIDTDTWTVGKQIIFLNTSDIK